MSIIARWLAAVLLLTITAAPAQLTAAAAPEEVVAGQPQVLIDNVLPHAPKRRGTLTLVGRFANTGETTLPAPTVQLRFSPTRLISREEISQVLQGTSPRSGTVLPTTITPLGDELQPGQQSDFRLQIPVRDLRLPASAGVYSVFVEALAGGLTQATSGTVFPWFPEAAEFEPSQLSLVWPITQRPAMAAQRLVVDAQMPAEYQPGGRIERLIRQGDSYPVSWLVDAATLQAADEMAEGYQVLSGGRQEPGDATAAARSTADRLKGILDREPWVELPQYGISDDEALTAGGLSGMVVRSASLPLVVRDVAADGSLAGLVYVAVGDTPMRQTLTTLLDAGVRVALMSDAAFPPEPALPYTPSGLTTVDAAGTSIDVLLTDSRLGSYLEGPFATAAERSTALQGMLAETAMITLERPAEPRNVAAAPPLLWDPPESWTEQLLTQLTAAPWIRLIGLDGILDGDSEVPRQDLGALPGGASRPLPQRYVQRLAGLQSDLASLTSIVDEPDGFGETFSLAIQRAGSALWRKKRKGRVQLISTIDAQLQQERNRVAVVSSGTVTLAGDSGIVPLTVANDLDRSVTVGIELQSPDGIGFEYQEQDPVTIAAEAKAGLEIPVRVIGSQPVTVDVIITDRDGLPFSKSASFELRSTAATRIAGVIVGVGGVTLAILVALNLWRRRRTREQEVQ